MRNRIHALHLLALLLVASIGTPSVAQRPDGRGRRYQDPEALVLESRELRQLSRALSRRDYQSLLGAKQRYEAAENARDLARKERRRHDSELRNLESLRQASSHRVAEAARLVQELRREQALSARRRVELRERRAYLEREVVILDRTVRYLLEVAGPSRLPVPAHRAQHHEWRRSPSLLDGLLDHLRDPERCTCLVDDAEARLRAAREELVAVRREEELLRHLGRRIREAERESSLAHSEAASIEARYTASQRLRDQHRARREALRRERNQRCEEWNRELLRCRALVRGGHGNQPPRPRPRPGRVRDRARKVQANWDKFLALVRKSQPGLADQLDRGAPVLGPDPDGTVKFLRGDFKKWAKRLKREPRFGPIRTYQGQAREALKWMRRSNDQDISHIDRGVGGENLFLLYLGGREMLVIRHRPGERWVYQDIWKP